MEAIRDRLEEFLAQVLLPALNRSQQRQWGSAFVRGFLLDGDRKSAGAIAERLPDGNEQAMQQFVTDSVWDFRDVRRRIAQQLEPLLPAEGVWIQGGELPDWRQHEPCYAGGQPAIGLGTVST